MQEEKYGSAMESAQVQKSHIGRVPSEEKETCGEEEGNRAD